jgi:DNA-binding transcriptional ArsR family regulator
MREVILDKKTFEALAMDTRVNILKALKERRKTQSELSKELSLAPSTVSEHLDKMMQAELLIKNKDHRKWIYYELTEKGENILSPQKTSVFVFALSFSLLLIAGFMFFYFLTGSFSSASVPAAAPGAFEDSAAPLKYAAEQAPAIEQSNDLIVLAIILIIAVILIYIYRMRK